MNKTLKDNQLIAEFMGLTVNDNNVVICKESIISHNERCLHGYNIAFAKYNTSWDWLMPVVIKMVSMDKYYIFRYGATAPYLEGNPLCIFSTTEEYDVNFTLTSLYEEVIEFIKWYNKQKS